MIVDIIDLPILVYVSKKFGGKLTNNPFSLNVTTLFTKGIPLIKKDIYVLKTTIAEKMPNNPFCASNLHSAYLFNISRQRH